MTAVEPQGYLQTGASILRLCALAGVSRAGYYRHFGPHPPAREDADLRDLIQRLALKNRHYGYRRITALLRAFDRAGVSSSTRRSRHRPTRLGLVTFPGPP